MKNETCYKDMIDIVLHHHKYVPKITSTTDHFDDINDSSVPIVTTKFHRTVFGGDQLTTSRMRGSQLDRVTSDTAIEQLKGVIPAFEDWHAQWMILQVRNNCILDIHCACEFICRHSP